MADGEPTDDPDRDAVIEKLQDKLSSLNDASSELTMAFADATTSQRAIINMQLNAISLEQTACTNRIQDLEAMKPFTRPDDVAEQALLDAIAAVGRLVNMSASMNAVIKAADALVKAYTAKGTK